MNMIKVYFDYGSTTEHVATFNNEEMYMRCLEALEKEANECRAKLIESRND